MANPFPDIYPDAGWEISLESLGDIDFSVDGIAQIDTYDPAEPFHGIAHWKLLSGSDLDTLVRPHYASQKDSNVGFSIFDFDPHVVTALACGTGNGGTTIFTIPAKAVSGQTVKDNGAAVSGSAYTILAGTGADGEDQISFTVAPLNTHVITIDATSARRRYTVIYITRKWAPKHNEANLWILDLEFYEKVA
jgi:hypothetical protein